MEKKVQNIVQREPLYQEVITIFKNGGSKKDVFDSLKRQYPHRTEQWRYDVYSNAVSLIKKDFKIRKNSLIGLHLMRYEQIWEKYKHASIRDVDHLEIPQSMKEFIVAEKLATAMTALQSKERLLGLHSKKAKIQINDFFNTDNENKVTYDFSKFKFEDIVRIKNILMSIRQEEDGSAKNSITIEDGFEETNDDLITKEKTIDIDHQEVPNVAQFLNETITTPNKILKPDRTVDDIKQSIEQSNTKEFEDKLKNKSRFLEKINKKISGK